MNIIIKIKYNLIILMNIYKIKAIFIHIPLILTISTIKIQHRVKFMNIQHYQLFNLFYKYFLLSQGFNATILAYGQTGTGKTHTMEGFNYT